VIATLFLGAWPPQAFLNRAGRAESAIRPDPRRVAVYPPFLAAYVTIDQSASHVAAASESERRQVAAGLFGNIFPELQDLRAVSTLGRNSAIPGDREQILLLAPDAVVVWAWSSGGVEMLGVPLISIGNSDAFAAWRSIGLAEAKEQRVDWLTRRSEDENDSLVTEVEGLHLGERQSAMMLWRNGTDGWSMAAGGHAVARRLRRLGASGPSLALPMSFMNTSNVPVNVETLLRFDPDVIFLACCASAPETPSALFGDPTLQPLTAVRNRRIYIEPIGGARMDGLVELPLLSRWCAELLYPNQLGQKFRSQYREAYEEVYGFIVDDDALDHLISFEENKASAGYLRFARRQGFAESE
jgi:iron complex transport system substrate-binding protein